MLYPKEERRVGLCHATWRPIQARLGGGKNLDDRHALWSKVFIILLRCCRTLQVKVKLNAEIEAFFWFFYYLFLWPGIWLNRFNICAVWWCFHEPFHFLQPLHGGVGEIALLCFALPCPVPPVFPSCLGWVVGHWPVPVTPASCMTDHLAPRWDMVLTGNWP